MKHSVVLSVKGTKYYSASRMLQAGGLTPGEAISFRREPHNPHDANAVEVLLTRGLVKLGHISKTSSPKYADLIQRERIERANIKSVTRSEADVNINICVLYESDDNADAIKIASLLLRSCSSLSTSGGVYAIKNANNSRIYIGSSQNVRVRVRGHAKALFEHKHDNALLQADFDKFGANCFEAYLIEECRNGAWVSSEARSIQRYLEAGNILYNMTEDGNGRRPLKGRGSNSSISDRKGAYYKAEAVRKMQREFEVANIDPLIKQIEPLEEFLRLQLAGVLKSIFGATISYEMHFARYLNSKPHVWKLNKSQNNMKLIDAHRKAIDRLKSLREQCDAIANT